MSAEVMSGGGGSPKLQTKTVSPSTSSQNITPDSNYDGLSKVTVNAMPAGSLNGISINSNGLITSSVGTSGYLSNGTSKTLQLSTQGSKTITPGKYSQTAVSSGTYATGTITVSGDTNLRSSNIANGVTIFGHTGNYEGEGLKMYQTTKSVSSSTNFGWVNTPTSNKFAPKAALITSTGATVNSGSFTDHLILSVYLERDSSDGTSRIIETVANYRSSKDVVVVGGSVYSTTSTIENNYTVTWDFEGIKVVSAADDFVFDDEYEVILFG